MVAGHGRRGAKGKIGDSALSDPCVLPRQVGGNQPPTCLLLVQVGGPSSDFP